MPAPLADMQPGERGRVVRVIDGDAIVLDTGQSVRLVGIEAPAPGRSGRPSQPYAQQAARILENMAMGRTVQLFYPGLTRDRYGRALAHIMTVDGPGPRLWLNMELVRQGAARVRLYSDTDQGGHALLAAEIVARDTAQGLWQQAAYRVRPAANMRADQRGFTVMTARLGALVTTDSEADEADDTACHRTLIGAGGLRITVHNDAAPVCALPNGTKARLRGWMIQGDMALTHPLHAEILPDQLVPGQLVPD